MRIFLQKRARQATKQTLMFPELAYFLFNKLAVLGNNQFLSKNIKKTTEFFKGESVYIEKWLCIVPVRYEIIPLSKFVIF